MKKESKVQDFNPESLVFKVEEGAKLTPEQVQQKNESFKEVLDTIKKVGEANPPKPILVITEGHTMASGTMIDRMELLLQYISGESPLFREVFIEVFKTHFPKVG